MAYITGTLTDANAPATLYAAVATALTTAGYTLVDTVVISTRTHKVWKNPAANNPANLDWYLDVVYTTTGAGILGMYPMEFFDPATDLAYRNCYSLGIGGAPDGTYYSRNGASGYALENANLGLYAGSNPNRDMSCPATTFGYWISVTNRRVVYLGSQLPTTFYYVGLYEPDPMYATFCGASLFPLASVSYLGVSSASYQALSRYPKETTSINWDTKLSVNPLTASHFPALPSGSQGNNNLFKAARMTMYSSFGGAARFGYLYDVACVSASGTVLRGDTVTIDGQSWVLTTPSGGYSNLFAAI